MNIMPLPMIVPREPAGTADSPKGSDGKVSFGDMLSKAINEVNSAQVKADEATKGFLVGDIQDIHQVTIAAEEAKIMLELAVEVRNKVVEAYQEISRMQV